MGKFNKVNFAVYIIVCFLFFEAILQAISFSLSLEIRKHNLTKGGDFNILCIGDSFTYGIGAPAQDSYPRQLEKILNKIYAHKYIHVINLGISGYNSSQCLKILKKNIDSYKPKIILVMSGMNNRWNFLESNYFNIGRFRYDKPLNFRIKLVDASLSRLKTYKLIKIFFLNFTAMLKSNQSQQKKDSLPIREFPMPQRSNELVELLKQGLRCYEQGEYGLSEIYYRKALDLYPDDYESHWYVGRLYICKGEREKAKEELILAAKYAPHPYTVSCILATIQDWHQSKNSEEFKEFYNLIKKFRNYWVEKFSEEYVHQFIDTLVSYEENDLIKVLYFDLEEMANYSSKNKAKLVILTYPHPSVRFRYPLDIYNRISNYLDLPLVDNVSLFNKYSKIYSHKELFSDDGHCTDKGYKLIAENIAEVLKKHNLLH